MNSLTGNSDNHAHDTTPMLAQTSEKVSALLLQGLDAVQGAGKKLLDQASNANQVTVEYIRKEPVKSVLIAAATGALLGALLMMVTRSRS
ncbi:hypothetical protein AZ34_13495 [Hylemonella gracilis str. Niagara R]|uniref:DUF883 domain-containing protein n=1 Tax=Hylemonella gracilis str. Niagara R TaxID=1458275 RepID=A0A016XM06_9BURK|nr:hypothetical protein [Hylemonella gracilis]EYC52930.1 hypothetical protein AZ34_13495 [Hylemonella gracilis str. Niagara R]